MGRIPSRQRWRKSCCHHRKKQKKHKLYNETIHYQRGMNSLLEMCIKYKDGHKEITSMPNYCPKLEGGEDEAIDLSDNGSIKAWNIRERIIKLSEGSMQYSNVKTLNKNGGHVKQAQGIMFCTILR